jgi:hypothetical protein
MQSAIAFAITYLTASLSNAHEFITVPQDLQTHPDWGSFEDFTRIYVKTYPADELRSRFSTFVHSIDQVSRPTHISGAESALNRFSDMNAHEFREAVAPVGSQMRASHRISVCVQHSGLQIWSFLSCLPKSIGVVRVRLLL